MGVLAPIGALRERIRIETRQPVSDGAGGTVIGPWRTVASGIPAKIAPVRGGEEIRSLRLSGVSLFDITVRATADTTPVTTSHRVVNERTGASFNVKWVANLDERGRFLTLTAEAGGLLDG